MILVNETDSEEKLPMLMRWFPLKQLLVFGCHTSSTCSRRVSLPRDTSRDLTEEAAVSDEPSESSDPSL